MMILVYAILHLALIGIPLSPGSHHMTRTANHMTGISTWTPCNVTGNSCHMTRASCLVTHGIVLSIRTTLSWIQSGPCVW